MSSQQNAFIISPHGSVPDASCTFIIIKFFLCITSGHRHLLSLRTASPQTHWWHIELHLTVFAICNMFFYMLRIPKVCSFGCSMHNTYTYQYAKHFIRHGCYIILLIMIVLVISVLIVINVKQLLNYKATITVFLSVSTSCYKISPDKHSCIRYSIRLKNSLNICRTESMYWEIYFIWICFIFHCFKQTPL